MSEPYNCETCGLLGERAWGRDNTLCGLCSHRTEYNPDGIELDEAEVGMEVSHLYFDGEIERINGFDANVSVTSKDNGDIGDYVEDVPLSKLERNPS